MAYRGRYGADSGGGFTESIALDPQTAGQYCAGGDTWGMRVSTSWGNEWWGSMSGLAALQNPPHARSVFFSKRPTTSGLRFYGTGANGSTGGTFYYGLPGGFVVNAIGGSGNGFGLGLGATSGVNGTARRPCGQLIDSYVTGGGGEYIFTLTRSGLDMFANTSGASGIAAKAAAISGTPATLLTTADIGDQQRLFVEVLDATRLVVINWDHNVTNTGAQTTGVYLVYTTAADWSGATSGNTHALGPLSITPPKGRVYEIHRGKDGNLYAAAGYDGVYTVTLSGTGASSTLGWSKPSGQTADVIVCSVDADSTGVVWAGQCAGAVGGTDYNDSTTGMPIGHSVVRGSASHTSWTYPASGSAVHFAEFQAGDTATGTGRTWWLSTRTTPLGQPNHDVAMIRVDPFDDQKVILCGRSGAWMTRNGGTGWYPAMSGLNGGQTGGTSPHIVTTGPSSWSADNTDFGEAHTSDNWNTAVKGSSYTTAGGKGKAITGATTYVGDDAKTYVFTPATASAPAKLTQNGTKISDDRFEGAIISAASMAVSQNGTVGIFQNGGATFVMDPTGGSGGGGGTTAPTITSFTPTTQSVGGSVTVTGSGFTGTTAVKVNATSVVTYSILDDGTLTLTVPVGATTGAISVTANGLTGTSTSALNVTGAPPAQPTITSITPTSGTPGSTITVTGTNLASATSVKIGGAGGTSVTPVTDTSTQITFKIPVGATSGVIFVQTAGGSVSSTQTLSILPSPTGGRIANLPQGALSRTATMQIPGKPMWTTDTQAAQVGQECVFISGPITMPRLATIMQANPSILIAPYLKSIQNPAGATDYDATGTKYPNKWYAHMKDGTKAKQGGAFINWVMESGKWASTQAAATVVGPLSGTSITASSWAQHHILDAIAAVSQWNAKSAQSGTRPFRALWFDTMGVFSANATPGFWTSTTNPGWNPNTNAAYTKPQFDTMAYHIGDQARSATLNPANLWVCGNGLRVNDATDSNGQKISAHVDMAMSEGWVATGGSAVPTRAAAGYQALLQLALDCQADGAVAELYEWGSSSDTTATTTQRRRFAAASNLIVNRGLATYEFGKLKTTAPWLETAADPNLYTMNLGLPLNGQSPSLASGHAVAVGSSNGQASAAGLYARSYDGGIAIANPTATSINYKADRTYTTIPTVETPTPATYTTGTLIAIPAASGVILTTTPSGSAPVNTAAPYILNSPVEGETLRRDEGIWTGNPTPVFSDQWQVSPNGSTGWADITGATSSTFPIPFGTGGTSSTTIAADTYARTVATGWGSADTGGAYTVQQGASSDFAVTASGTGSSGGYVQTLDQQSGGTSATTITLTIPTGGVPTGHTIIVAAGANNKNVTGVTDTAGNTYTQDSSVLPGSAVSLNLFSAKVTTGLSAGNTITITYAATVAGRVAVAVEHQGFLTASWNDTATTHTTSSTATTNTSSSNTASAATAQANEIIVSAIIIGAGGTGAVGTPTADAAYTLRATAESTGTIRRVALQSKKDTAVETPTASWSWGAGNAYAHILTSYKLIASTASVGTVSHSVANTGKMITLAVNKADVDVYWDSNFPTTATGGNLQSSPMVRWQDANNYLDLNAVLFSADGSLNVAPRKVIGGTATNLGTAKLFGTYSTSDYIHYRLKVVGNHIQAKAWLGSASEPGSWDWDFNDSSITTAGAIGARSYKGAANTTPNPVTAWDNLSATAVTSTVAGYVTDYFRDNVTGTNANGTSTVSSGVVGPVTSGATGEPQWTTLPSISGSAAELQTLTATPGVITGSPTPTVSYQWQTSSDGSAFTWSDVSGATASTWAIPTGNANLYTRCKITATNSVAAMIAYTPKLGPIVGSDAVPQFTVAPSIAGAPVVGQTLAMSTGTITGNPTPTTVQVWQSSPDAGVTWNDTLITDTSYLLDGNDAGALIRVAVTASNRAGQTEAFSAPVGPVQQASSTGLTIGVSVE